MTHYDEVLKEARESSTKTAELYVPKLFHILVDEEKRKPEEARAIIEHDLLDYWSKATVRKFLPPEAKDKEKVKAGAAGGKKKAEILVGVGNTVMLESNSSTNLKSDEPSGDDYEKEYKDSEEAKQTIKKVELAGAIEKPAMGFTKQDSEDWNSVTYRMGIKDLDRSEESLVRNMIDLIKKDLPALRNRGWMSVEVTMRVL